VYKTACMPNLSRSRLWGLSLLMAMWVVSSAQAQSKGKPPPGYAEAVAQALSELEAANYPEALEEFRRAHAIFPNARTLRGLGMVEFELRHYAESCRLLEDALTSKVKPLDGRQRSETEALLSRASRYIGEVEVTVEPAFATVLVDGASVDVKAVPTLTLEVGEHAIEVRAVEFSTQRREFVVKGGERTRLHVALERAPVAVAAADQASKLAEPVPLEKAPAPPERNPSLLWAGGVVLSAGLASELAGWLLFRDRVDKGEAVLASVDGSRAGPWEDARPAMIGVGAVGGFTASLGTALLASAVPAHKVPWWAAGAAGAVGAGLLAWGAVDLAKGQACNSSDARACVQDEQRQDRGILLLCSATPFLTLLITKGVRSATPQEPRVDLSLSMSRATLSGTW
jgi:tetratricopeptide (TPR) repeat protein